MKRHFLAIASIILSATASNAHAGQSTDAAGDSILFTISKPEAAPVISVDKEDNLGHFAWGADLGSSIDLTANDMTAIDINGYFGYKGGWMRFAGIGAGITSMLSNASRSYPVYAMARTSFSSRPQLCFLDLRLGVSFNSILDYSAQTDFFGSIGLGVTLAKGKKFASHIILSYTFMPLRTYKIQAGTQPTTNGEEIFEDTPAQAATSVTETSVPDLHYASIRIGCSF